MEKSNFYKKTLPELINKYKIVIRQCLDIIEKPIDEDLSDDKLHNVLKAKRMASEDVKFYAKEIEKLENEIKGIDEDVIQDPKNVLKKFTKK